MAHLKTTKMKALHHPEYHLTTQLKIRVQTQGFNAQKACLSKYFPKYYRNLTIEIPAGDWSIGKKLRQTKVIGHFTGSSDDYRSGYPHSKRIHAFEQRIFRDKRKSVKSLPLFFSPSERKRFYYRDLQPSRFQFSTLFPKLAYLNLSSIQELELKNMKSIFVSRELEQEIKRSYGYFWNSLRDLKYLEISNENEKFWFMIQQINSSSHFLPSLKTLKLSLAFYPDPRSNSKVRDLLQQLAKNDHLLSDITHLNCQEFEILHHFDEIMGTILAKCSKLLYLSILIGREANYYADLKGIFPEHKGTKVFEQISKMNKLQTLNISVFGIESFVHHFYLPSSVQKLVLYIGKSMRDESYLDLFLDPQYNFFERWKGLPNLHTLELKMRMVKNPDDLFHKFVNPLLEVLHGSLKKFSFEVTDEAVYFSKDEIGVIDFSLLSEKNSSLESVKILAEDRKITFDPKKSHSLSGLTKIAINGKFSKKFDAKSFLDLFIDVPQSQQRSLKLSTFKFESIETFDEFLQLSKKTGNLLLDLKIDLFVDKDLTKLFNHFKEPVNLGKNCAVALTIWLIPPVDSRDKKKELPGNDKSAFQQIFGNFKLKVIQKATYSGWNHTLLEF